MVKNIIIGVLLILVIYFIIEKIGNKYITAIICNEKIRIKTTEKFENPIFSSKDIDDLSIRYESLGCLHIDKEGNKYEIFKDDRGNYMVFHLNRNNGEINKEYIKAQEVEWILENL